MKAAHPMPFPAARQPSATEPPYLRTVRPSVASRPERDTGRKRSRMMLSRQQRDATPGCTACIAASPAVPQTQPQTCGHVSAVPTRHPVRPAKEYGTDKDSIGGAKAPPILSFRCGTTTRPTSLPPTCLPAGLRRNNRPLYPPRHPTRVSHPLSPPCLHSTVRDGSQEHGYRKYRTPIPERCRA